MKRHTTWRAVVTAGLLTWGTVTAGPGQEPASSVAVSSLSARDDGRVEVLVSVVDNAGRPRAGLGASNFQLYLDGQQVTGLTVAPQGTDEGLSVVLAVDASGSMKGTKMAAAQQAALEFLQLLRPQDEVAVMTFGDDVRWRLADLTADHQAAAAAIQAIVPDENASRLYEGLLQAARKGATAPSRRSAVVMITDGHDQTSSIKLDDAVDEAQQSNVQFYMLGFGDQVDEDTLRKAALLTGGRSYVAGAGQQLSDLFKSVFEQLSNQYRLTASVQPLGQASHTVKVICEARGETLETSRTFTGDQTAPVPGPSPEPPAGGATNGGGSSGGEAEPPGTAPVPGPGPPIPTPGEADANEQLGTWIGMVVLGLCGVLALALILRSRGTKPAACTLCGNPLGEAPGPLCTDCAPQAPASPMSTDTALDETVDGDSTVGDAAVAAAAEPATATLGRLHVIDAPDRSVEVTAGAVITIGRLPHCDLAFEGDRYVSKSQAVVWIDEHGRCVLENRADEDPSGTKGTYLNGRRITQPEPLRDGDEIGLNSAEPKLRFTTAGH